MRAKSNATRRYSSKPDSDLPELTDEILKRGRFKIGGKRVSHAEGAAAFRKAQGPGWQTRMAARLAR